MHSEAATRSCAPRAMLGMASVDRALRARCQVRRRRRAFTSPSKPWRKMVKIFVRAPLTLARLDATGRTFFCLSHKCDHVIVAGLETNQPPRRDPKARPLPDDALERGTFLCRFGQRRGKGARRAGHALQNLLATGFRLHLPQGPLRSRCSGPDTGFFCNGA